MVIVIPVFLAALVAVFLVVLFLSSGATMTLTAVYILRIVTISMDEVQSLGFGLFGRFL